MEEQEPDEEAEYESILDVTTYKYPKKRDDYDDSGPSGGNAPIQT
jgi:hypothetical protein